MAELKAVIEYNESGDIATVTLSPEEDIDLNNDYFHIDIIDMIKANNYYKTHEHSDVYNDETEATIIRIDKNNYRDYNAVNFDANTFSNNKSGVILYYDDATNSLILKFLRKSILNIDSECSPIGFCSLKVIVGFNSYNDIVKNKEVITEFNINFVPSIFFGDIQKLKETDEDPTLETSAHRYDYQFTSDDYTMYVNTSAGTSPFVPYYIVDSSAFLPSEYCDPSSETYLEYDFEAMESRLVDPNNENNYIEIPYEFIEEGVSASRTICSGDNFEVFTDDKAWVIRQTISTSSSNLMIKGNLTLSVSV